MTTYGSLFSGVGGLEMGVQAVLGGEVAWHAEIDPGACKVLAHRYPNTPNLGDITRVDWATVPPVNVLCAGFPCQDVSVAGAKAGLLRGQNRSGLWGETARAIATLRPDLVVLENVRGLLSAPADSDVEPCPWCLGDGSDEPHLRALGAVLADLADIGYDAWWIGLPASDIGAAHRRFRVFIFAVPADTQGDTWRLLNRDHEAIATPMTTDQATGDSPTDWGEYSPVIERWAAVIGRPAPPPIELGPKGEPWLSARFVEWLMGWPDGWVTDTPGVTRAEALKCGGDGVVWQQSAEALKQWLALITKQIGEAA